MRVTDIIQKKRDNESLREDEIRYLIAHYTKADIPDYQMSAFLMAVYLNGMPGAELAVFTDAMLKSGLTIDLSDVPGVIVDKHSTGGVGDKITIPLIPAVAACGVPVPTIAGRGLGHSGGTIDKLESIPGYRVNLTIEQYRNQVKKIGACMMGQTDQVAPADKKIYALRDVTSTVESIPLIASSIMSKKLAEGIHGLVLDVKFGAGAFMQKMQDAELLAKYMVDIGTRMGKQIVARMTSTDQPNGIMVGNALEIIESLDILAGHGPADVVTLVVELGAEMLVMGKHAQDLEEGRSKITRVLQNGRAMEKFAQIIEAQGGDPRVIENRVLLPKAKAQKPVLASRDGYIASMRTKQIGFAAMALGGGRQQATDVIDHAVGIEMRVRIGDFVKKGDPLCILHTNQRGEDHALEKLADTFQFSDNPTNAPALFGPRITHEK